jgi:hypothetical protein
MAGRTTADVGGSFGRARRDGHQDAGAFFRHQTGSGRAVKNCDFAAFWIG